MYRKVILTAFALLAVVSVAYAAEQGRTGLSGDVTTDLADSSDITAAELRGVMTDVIDSNFNLTDDTLDDVADGTDYVRFSSADNTKLDAIDASSATNGQVLTADGSGGLSFDDGCNGNPVVEITADTELTNSHIGGTLLYNSSGAGTLTVPTGLTIGDCGLVSVYQTGAGTLTFASGSGFTLNSYDGFDMLGQHGSALIQFLSSTSAYVTGHLN